MLSAVFPAVHVAGRGREYGPRKCLDVALRAGSARERTGAANMGIMGVGCGSHGLQGRFTYLDPCKWPVLVRVRGLQNEQTGILLPMVLWLANP